MKLQDGETTLFEFRQSRIIWVWPFLKALLAGGISFGFFWLLNWATYKLSIGEESVFQDRRILAASYLVAVFLVLLMLRISWWVRCRRKARLNPPAPTEEVPDLTSEVPAGKLRSIATKRVSRHYRAEKTIAILVGVLLILLYLFAIQLGKHLIPEHAAIFYGATILLLVFAYHLFTWRHTTYALTSRRLVTECGWFAKNVWEIPLAECRHIEGKRNLVQKLFGYGHLTIAGVGTINEYLAFIPKPEKFRETLLNAMNGPTTPAPAPVVEPEPAAPVPAEDSVLGGTEEVNEEDPPSPPEAEADEGDPPPSKPAPF